MTSKKMNQLRRKSHRINADLNYGLEVFGDELAKRNGYKVHDGMDAIYFYLASRHSWPPSQVRGMSHEDLRFMLEEEMHGWTWPKNAR